MAAQYFKKNIFLSFDEFFRYACKCGTIVKFVKTTIVLLELQLVHHTAVFPHVVVIYHCIGPSCTLGTYQHEACFLGTQ